MNGARHIEAAAGHADCDLNIVGARVADLYRGVLVEGATVSIAGGAVVGVNDGLRARETFDAAGRVLAPGFTDACSFDRSVQREKVTFARNFGDDANYVFHLIG